MEFPCAPIPVFNDTTNIANSGGIVPPITTEGYYCLAENITYQLRIEASNVTLDMNYHKVTNGILLDGDSNATDNITIYNGTIDGNNNDGISIATNDLATNIYLTSLNIQNCNIGINFNNVTTGRITNCNLDNNEQGMLLQNSSKIDVTNTIANCNMINGFGLTGSNNNSFTNCRALYTGEGNNDTTTTSITGFQSSGGSGNRFDNCLASYTIGETSQVGYVAGFSFINNEQYSIIKNSESANTRATGTGTIPYGILLKDELVVDFIPKDSFIISSSNTDIFKSLNWSNSGVYIACLHVDFTSNNTPDDIYIIKFDRSTNSLIQKDKISPYDTTLTYRLNNIKWSPNDMYIATVAQNTSGTAEKFRIYKFDSLTEKIDLTFTASGYVGAITGGDDIVNDLDWHPSGRFIAIVGDTMGTSLKLYMFNETDKTLTLIRQTADISNLSVNTVKWSPDGNFLAIGQTEGNTTIKVYYFNNTSAVLTDLVLAYSDTSDILTAINQIDWSNDGKYIAVAYRDGLVVFEVIYISSNDLTLNKITSYDQFVDSANNVLRTVSWSPDGKYLTTGPDYDTTIFTKLFILYFNKVNKTLTVAKQWSADTTQDEEVNYVDWSPDGQYIAAGINDANNTDASLYIFPALTFPQNNIIENNMVYNNTNEDPFCAGVGISGSSTSNLIIKNTAYSNPTPANPINSVPNPIVATNYYFVTNVFDGNSGGFPSTQQNISFAGRLVPSLLTYDIARYINVILNK
jgi:WD40 repeat protein